MTYLSRIALAAFLQHPAVDRDERCRECALAQQIVEEVGPLHHQLIDIQVLIDAIRGAARGLAYFSPAVRERLVVGKGARITLQGAGEAPAQQTVSVKAKERLARAAQGL